MLATCLHFPNAILHEGIGQGPLVEQDELSLGFPTAVQSPHPEPAAASL